MVSDADIENFDNKDDDNDEGGDGGTDGTKGIGNALIAESRVLIDGSNHPQTPRTCACCAFSLLTSF